MRGQIVYPDNGSTSAHYRERDMDTKRRARKGSPKLDSRKEDYAKSTSNLLLILAGINESR